MESWNHGKVNVEIFQYTVEPLVKAILAELSLPKPERDEDVVIEVACPDDKNDTPTGRGKMAMSGSSRKRKLVDDPPRTSKVAGLSKTYKLLQNRIGSTVHTDAQVMGDFMPFYFVF